MARNTFKYRCQQYGITEKLFWDTYVRQDGRCAICELEITKSDAHIDHCHETNEFRGLLCMNCNTGLGHFKDDVSNLIKAQIYLTNAIESDITQI